MSLAPLFNASLAIQLHAFAAVAAFVLALAQFAGPKGTIPHRVAGWTWVALMLLVAGSSFFIAGIELIGPFSPIHLLSIYVIALLPFAVRHARRGKSEGTSHRNDRIVCRRPLDRGHTGILSRPENAPGPIRWLRTGEA